MINLTHTVQRIQPEYFKELLLNPQATQLGTLMPPLFMGRKKADQEIERSGPISRRSTSRACRRGCCRPAITNSNRRRRSGPSSSARSSKARACRRWRSDFPQQIHAAFDALEVRWALAWKGRFLDAMTTWEERAMTPAKPLGEKVRALPASHAAGEAGLGLGCVAGGIWRRRGGLCFKGYRLGKDGVPVFLYEVNGLRVEDAMRPDADGNP